jgi:hypothetical protein
LLGFNGNGEVGSKVLGASTVLIGQQLFTPRDTTTSAPLPDDRPYAGWAYLGLRQELLQPLEPSTSSGSEGHRRWRTHSFELQLGVVGPSAGGEWTQRRAHDFDESPQSNGWHNQITDRFGWQAYYNFSNRMWSFDIGGCCDALVGDVLLQAMGAAGNLQQYAEAGGVVRLGRNMGPMAQRTMVPSALTASLRPIDAAAAKLNSDTTTCDTVWLFRPQECYVFAGVAARGVVKNIFLDKTTTGAGANISPEEFVYEFTWGARLRYNWVRFDYISSTRTREFEPSPGNPLDSEGRHSFGSLTMSCYGQFGNNSGKLQWVCPGFVFGVAAFLAARD